MDKVLLQLKVFGVTQRILDPMQKCVAIYLGNHFTNCEAIKEKIKKAGAEKGSCGELSLFMVRNNMEDFSEL